MITQETAKNSVENIVIPTVEIIDGNNRKVSDIFSALNDARIVICDGEINDQMASIVCAQLLYLDSINSDKSINMYINSPGGSVTAGMAIFDTMTSVKCNVNTLAMGLCASMGAFLFAAGNVTGSAIALPHAEIMIHQPLGGFKGQATDISIHANRILRMKTTLTAYLAYFAAQNPNSIIGKMDTVEERIGRLEVDCERDTFMTAEEALNYGLASQITKKGKLEKMLSEIKNEGYLK